MHTGRVLKKFNLKTHFLQTLVCYVHIPFKCFKLIRLPVCNIVTIKQYLPPQTNLSQVIKNMI
jgi:hypothetical protein